MAEHKTTLLFDARTQNFEKVAQQARKLHDALRPGGLTKEFQDLQEQLAKLAPRRGPNKATARRAENMAKHMAAAEKSMVRMEAMSEKMERRFANIRGLMGDMPSTLPSGGGGFGGRGFGGGGSSGGGGGFGGLMAFGGRMTVLGALAWAGKKTVGAAMGPGMSAGEAALARDQARIGFAPFMGDAAETKPLNEVLKFGPRQMHRNRVRELESLVGENRFIVGSVLGNAARRKAQREGRDPSAAEASALQDFVARKTKESADKRDADIRALEARNRANQINPRFASIRGIGERFGIGEPAAMQAASAVLGRSGGLFRGQESLVATALGAQTMGVGLGTSGVFGGMARNRAIAGGGSGAGVLAEAMSRGQRMGFQGAELGQFMDRFASVLEEFQRTGVRVDMRGSMAVAEALTKRAGFNRFRAVAAAEGLRAGAARIGDQGPGDAIDAMALQELGGFSGGTLGDFFMARERMREGEFLRDPEALSRLLTRYSGLFQGISDPHARGAALSQTVLPKVGLQVSGEEATRLMEAAQRGDLDSIRAMVKRRGRSAAAIQQAGESRIGGAAPEAGTQAGLENQLAAAGDALKTMTMNIKALNIRMAEATNNFAGPLTEASGALEDFAAALRDATGSGRD